MTVRPALIALLVAATLPLAARDASALTCYVVFDRSDNVTYRDVYPPVDLSDAGRAEREAMRRRGEYLLFLETDQCPRIEYFTGNAGTIGLQLDQAQPATAMPRERSVDERSVEPRVPRRQGGVRAKDK
jgi:hypothetical protein